MPLVKILEHFPSTENYQVGDEVDITNPAVLLAEGKVELVDQPQEAPVEPVTLEPTVGSQPEGAEEPVEKTAPVETPVTTPKEPIEETETPVEETEAPVTE